MPFPRPPQKPQRHKWLILTILSPISIYALEKKAISLEDYLSLILAENPEIAEAQEGIAEKNALLYRIHKAIWPKSTIIGIGMPTPAIEGNALQSRYNWRKWNALLRTEITITQALYTFGRYTHGKEAALNAIEVERALTSQAEQKIILRSKRFFYGYLLAYSSYHNIILPTEEQLNKAIEHAEEEYDKASGTVSKADLGRLHVARGELLSKKAEAKKLLKLTEAALRGFLPKKHHKDLTLPTEEISEESIDFKTHAEYTALAFAYNPQYTQLQHGIRAREEFMQYQRAEKRPVLFIRAQFSVSWAPHITKQASLFANDPFNNIFGYAALGIKWDLDFSQEGLVKQSEAEHRKLLHKHRYARDGLPLLIQKHYSEIQEAKELIKIHHTAYRQALSWMAFSLLAFETGTGSAKDALEGLAATALAQFRYYESIYKYNMGLARMSHAVGKEISKLEYLGANF